MSLNPLKDLEIGIRDVVMELYPEIKKETVDKIKIMYNPKKNECITSNAEALVIQAIKAQSPRDKLAVMIAISLSTIEKLPQIDSLNFDSYGYSFNVMRAENGDPMISYKLKDKK